MGIQNRAFMTTKGDCGRMKIVILITVIESLAVMLAIVYFYYRRSQLGKRALSSPSPARAYYAQAQTKLVLAPSNYSQWSQVFKGNGN
jgi:hypothetical protein